MPNTPKGITYPSSTAHTRMWEHFQTLAQTADDAIGALIGPWTSYTPVVTGTGGNPVVTSALGRWRRTGVNTASFQSQVVFGTGAGGGFYSQSLPFTTAAVGFDQTCLVGVYDLSAARHYVGRGLINPSSSSIVRMHVEGGVTISAAGPMAFASGDIMYSSGTVEVLAP